MTREEAINEIKSWAIPSKKGREVLETLIPELAENEDERIRKELANFLRSPFIKENLTDEKVAPWIAYLEKQKDQKHLSTEEIELNSIAFLEQMGYTCIPPRKEQKLAEYLGLDNASQDYVYNHFCQGADFTPDYIKGLMEDAFIDGANWQKEQKPADDEAKAIAYREYERGRESGLRDGQKYVLDNAESYGLCKPAKWSEDDSRMLSDIVGYITGTGSSSGITKQERADFLCGLSKRFNLQPKQELDEDTAQWVECIIKDYEQKLVEEPNHAATIQAKITVLKSLRPQPKQNVNDRIITPNKKFFQWIYDRLVNVHNENPNVDYMISFKRRIEELSVDKPSWKPSEEQMKALYCALNDAISLYSDKVSPLYEEISRMHFDALESLYNDLKKL